MARTVRDSPLRTLFRRDGLLLARFHAWRRREGWWKPYEGQDQEDGQQHVQERPPPAELEIHDSAEVEVEGRSSSAGFSRLRSWTAPRCGAPHLGGPFEDVRWVAPDVAVSAACVFAPEALPAAPLGSCAA
jgi:hypothetical protein